MTRADWLYLYEERVGIMLPGCVSLGEAQEKAWKHTTERWGQCPAGRAVR